jgi:hypothetical protein
MAQSIVGTELLARWQSSVSHPAHRVLVDWNRSGTFDDESAFVTALDVSSSVYDSVTGLPSFGRAQPDKARVVMNNVTRRYSPNNPAGLSGTYPNLLNGIYRIPIRIDMGYHTLAGVAQYTRQFTGEIEVSVETETGGKVSSTFECIGNSIEMLQHRSSSVLFENIRTDQFVTLLLIEAGLITAGVDVVNGVIPYAWVSDESLFDEVQALAESEGALFYFDKDGVAQFKRITTLLERPDSITPVVELNEGNAFLYADGLSWRDTYNEVVVEWASRYPGQQTELYVAPTTLVVPPQTMLHEELKYRYPAYRVAHPEWNIDYVAITSGARTVPYGDIEMFFDGKTQGADIYFTNNMTRHPVYIMNLVVRGLPLIGDEAHQERFQSPLGIIPGDKVYEYRQNPYIQTLEQALRLGGYLRDWLERPRRLYRWRGPAVPWLELLDRVTLKHDVMSPKPWN